LVTRSVARLAIVNRGPEGVKIPISGFLVSPGCA
jgi:hypothetical protein